MTLFDVGEDPQRVHRRDLDISDGVGETPDDDLIGPRIQRGQNLFAAFDKIIDVPLGITFAPTPEWIDRVCGLPHGDPTERLQIDPHIGYRCDQHINRAGFLDFEREAEIAQGADLPGQLKGWRTAGKRESSHSDHVFDPRPHGI